MKMRMMAGIACLASGVFMGGFALGGHAGMDAAQFQPPRHAVPVFVPECNPSHHYNPDAGVCIPPGRWMPS
jgi:hypothetical protein